MVEFSHPNVSESGGCWSRWWTSRPDSGLSPFSIIPVVYQAGFVSLPTRIFFFLAARIAVICRIRPVCLEFQFNCTIANFFSSCHVWITCVKQKQTLNSEVCVVEGVFGVGELLAPPNNHGVQIGDGGGILMDGGGRRTPCVLVPHAIRYGPSWMWIYPGVWLHVWVCGKEALAMF